MKTIFGSMKHSYFARIGILLIVVALVAGILSCNGAATYELIMAVNPAEGGTATDETGTSPYARNTKVDIKAVPADCYQFIGWTTSAGTLGNASALETTITIPAEDVTVTANFELKPADHYKFYQVYYEKEPVPIGTEVLLEDQFGTFTANVTDALAFGNPVEKEHAGLTPIHDPDRHYTVYWLDFVEEGEFQVSRSVEISNQFQNKVELTVWGPIALVVPTQKEDHEMVECLNHYLVYFVDEADYAEFVPVEGVNLKDQFIPNGEDVTVNGPMLFANPVKKTVLENGDVSEIEDPELHYVLYNIWDEAAPSIDKSIQIANQFGDNQVLNLTYRDVLAVPSQKNVPPTPPLDHFKCYQTLPQTSLEQPVILYDQFHPDYFEGVVMDPIMFCNPVDKIHGTVQISSNPDNHLTVYKISAMEDYWYTVTVDNQFNDAAVPQTLTVHGPVALAVPTQKLVPGDHDVPKYMDHYLLYEVWEPVSVDVTVDLDDQFPEVAENVTVGPPLYFANPALKGPIDWTGIWDPEEHLVFYAISDNPEFYYDDVVIKNQFCFDEPCYLELIPVEQLLAVPSVKVDWAPTKPPIP